MKHLPVDKAIRKDQDDHLDDNVNDFAYFCPVLHIIPLAPERIILGIDPGTNIMGYGIIRVEGTRAIMICLGVLKLNKTDDHFIRLKIIFEKTVSLIDQYNPDELSIEAPFFGKNIQSMLKLGRAQGAAIAAALTRSMPIFEYSPRKIKQSITGKGNASKEQVAAMLQRMLNIIETPEYLDATDGLAVAMCHFYQKNPTRVKEKYSGWQGFIKANPDKISGN